MREPHTKEEIKEVLENYLYVYHKLESDDSKRALIRNLAEIVDTEKRLWANYIIGENWDIPKDISVDEAHYKLAQNYLMSQQRELNKP